MAMFGTHGYKPLLRTSATTILLAGNGNRSATMDSRVRKVQQTKSTRPISKGTNAEHRRWTTGGTVGYGRIRSTSYDCTGEPVHLGYVRSLHQVGRGGANAQSTSRDGRIE